MDQNAWIELEQAHTSGVYPKRPIAIVRGEGARVWDADGVEYIDCVGGQGAANLGHAHPAIVRAISDQAATLITCPEIFHNDQRALLLERLTAVAPAGMNRAFLCNSGTEAVEAALKFARSAPVGRASWRPCAVSTGAPWARSRPPGSPTTGAVRAAGAGLPPRPL